MNEFNFTLNHNLNVLDKWSKVYITKMKTWRLKKFIYTKCCIKVSSLCSESRHATSIKQFRKSVSFSSQITCIFFIWSAFAWYNSYKTKTYICFKLLFFRLNSVYSPLCSCGMREYAYHFFFRLFSIARYKFMDRLLRLNELTIIGTLYSRLQKT